MEQIYGSPLLYLIDDGTDEVISTESLSEAMKAKEEGKIVNSFDGIKIEPF